MTKGEWMRVCTETGDPFPPFISNIYDTDVIRSRLHLCLKATRHSREIALIKYTG